MINKKVEADIKALKGFLEFWGRFHSIYTGMISRDTISAEDENKFFEAKSMMRTKYDELGRALDFKYMPHGRLTDPVVDILSLKTLRLVSEDNLKKMEDDWKDSYVFLNNIMEQLITKKTVTEGFNPVSEFFRRIFERV